LILAHGDFDAQQLRALGVDHIVRLTDTIWSIRFPPERLARIWDLTAIKHIEAPAPVSPLLSKSVGEIHARPQDLEDIRPTIDGTDVVIGVVDYGIDWTLPDFCDDTGSHSRIKFLWDQSLVATDDEHAPKDFDWGVEYRQRQIDQALTLFRAGKVAEALSLIRHRPQPASGARRTDVDGHGTHVTGIACGNGASSSADCPQCASSAGKYRGVAPKAWIVFVHLDRRRILSQVERGEGGLGNSVDLAEGIAYCYRKAEEISAEVGKPVPCVVNLSMGFNGGSHDGESLVERVIDSMLEVRGRALIVAAGNQRQERTHYFGRVAADQPCAVEWIMGFGQRSDLTGSELEIWYSSQDIIDVELSGPDGASTKKVSPGDRVNCDLYPNVGVVLDSERFTNLNSDARIYIAVVPCNGAKLRGVWTIRLTCQSPPQDGTFDAWIERKTEAIEPVVDGPIQSRFRDEDPDRTTRATTLLAPGTARRAVTVGAVGDLHVAVPRIYTGSGAGPTRDNRSKPEVVAPGINICSNAVQFDLRPVACTQVQKTGTSMACPHVAGVAALILQLAPDLTATQVRHILMASAAPRGGRTGFDPLWGFGVVNAREAVELVHKYFLR
jgi:subtilisin family serine protease